MWLFKPRSQPTPSIRPSGTFPWHSSRTRTRSTRFQNKPLGSGALGHRTVIPARGHAGCAAGLPPRPWQGDTSLSPIASPVPSAWRWPPRFPGAETAPLWVTPHHRWPWHGMGSSSSSVGPAPVLCWATSDARCRRWPPACLPAWCSHPRACRAHRHAGLRCLSGALVPCQGSFTYLHRGENLSQIKVLVWL